VIEIRNPEDTKDVSFLQNTATGSGAQPASYSVGPVLFAGWVKGQRLRMNGVIPPLLLYVLMALTCKTFKFRDWLKTVRTFDL
jgi:hypothetical protein